MISNRSFFIGAVVILAFTTIIIGASATETMSVAATPAPNPSDAGSIASCPRQYGGGTSLDCRTCTSSYNTGNINAGCYSYYCPRTQKCYATTSECRNACPYGSYGSGCISSGSPSSCPMNCPNSSNPIVKMSCGQCGSNTCYNSGANGYPYWNSATSNCHYSSSSCTAECASYKYCYCYSSGSCPTYTPTPYTQLCPGTNTASSYSSYTSTSCQTCFSTCKAWQWDSITTKCYYAGSSSSYSSGYYCGSGSSSTPPSSCITSLSGCPVVTAPPAGACPAVANSVNMTDCNMCSLAIYNGGCGGSWCPRSKKCYDIRAVVFTNGYVLTGASICGGTTYSPSGQLPQPFATALTKCQCPQYTGKPTKTTCSVCMSPSYCNVAPSKSSSGSSSSSYSANSGSNGLGTYNFYDRATSLCYTSTQALANLSTMQFVRKYSMCSSTAVCPSMAKPSKMDYSTCYNACGGTFCAGWCFYNLPAGLCPPGMLNAGISGGASASTSPDSSQTATTIAMWVLFGVFCGSSLLGVLFMNCDAIGACCTRWSDRRDAYSKIEDHKRKAREAKELAARKQREADEARQKKAREDAERKERERLAEERRQRVLMTTCTVKSAATYGSLWRDPDDGVWALHDVDSPSLTTKPVARFGPQLSILFPKAEHVKALHRSPTGRFLLVAGNVAVQKQQEVQPSAPPPPSAAPAGNTGARLLSGNNDGGYGSGDYSNAAAAPPSAAAAAASTGTSSSTVTVLEYQAWLFDLFDGGRAVTQPIIQQRAIRVDPSVAAFITDSEPEVAYLALVAVRWLDNHDPQVQGSMMRYNGFKACVQEYEDAVFNALTVVEAEKKLRLEQAESADAASSGNFSGGPRHAMSEDGHDDSDPRASLVSQHSDEMKTSKRSFVQAHQPFPEAVQDALTRRSAATRRYIEEVDKVAASVKLTDATDARLAGELQELSMALDVIGNYMKTAGQAQRGRANAVFAAAIRNAPPEQDENQKMAVVLHQLRHRALTAVQKWLDAATAQQGNGRAALANVSDPPAGAGRGNNVCPPAPPRFPVRTNTDLHKFAMNDELAGNAFAAATSSWDFIGKFPLAEVLDAVFAAENITPRALVALRETPQAVAFHREHGPMSTFADAEKLEHDAHELEHRYETVEHELLDLSIKLASLTVVAQHNKKDRSVERQLHEARKACSAKKRERDTVVMGFSKLFAVRPELQLVLAAPELDFEFDLLNSYVHRLLAGGQSRHRVFEAKSDGEQEKYDLIIKEYNLSEEKHRRRFAREMDLLRKAKHPRIVAINRVFFTADGSAAYVVMPRYPGTVQDFLQNADKSQVTTEWLRACVREAIRSVEHLHSLSILHLDIKPDNFLVDNDAMPILSDFDVSLSAEEMAKATATATSMGGTVGFCAPEVMKDPKSVGFKTDVFSLGRTFEELIKIIRQFFPECKISPALDELVSEMVKEDMAQRPDLCDALMHKYFTLDHLEREREMEAERRKREMELEAAKKQHAADVAQAQQKLADASQQQQAQIAAARKQLTSMTSAVAYMSPPAYWTNNDPFSDHYRKIDITASFKAQMQALMDQTCNSATLGSGRDQKINMKYSRLEVQKVYRIENMAVWRKYAEKKNEMRQHRPRRSYDTNNVETMKGSSFVRSHGLDRYVGEMYGWHGTAPGVADLIAEGGFEERLASTAGLFSSGLYTAEMASKSDQYTTPSPPSDHHNGTYSIFLARILFGTPYETNSFTERIPPLLNSNDAKGGRYDSILGRPTGALYREFIVYDKAQGLPEFLVEYKRR